MKKHPNLRRGLARTAIGEEPDVATSAYAIVRNACEPKAKGTLA